ncbi:hypothetical protein [Mammaliicoccus sciuri]|uniref:DUF5626 domain-containing protein n=1 Tax=Mammaliicoccus sciuri TaxID=1296 RepID=A0AAI8DKT7_MAMSC|nr:hypothetical protein [Mammaliicoccus sciuri]ASE35345.1 hypothetical protein CEP64_12345 [Mammaliicoccus sciuri]
MRKKAIFMSMVVIVSLVFIMFSQDIKASEKIENVSSDVLDKTMNEAVEDINSQLENGQNKAETTKMIPGTDEGIIITVENNELNDGFATRAAKKPSGKKNYSVSVRSSKSRWVPGFSHTLRGTFTYSKGKVNKYSRNVVASGTAYTHSSSSKAVRLDKSLVEITSVSKHKWLGKVGKISGLGYTSYLGVDLYGSGNYRLKYARYQPGL